jgi:hypothetical protein
VPSEHSSGASVKHGDLRNSARRRSEAAVERVKIGQSAGIEFGVDGVGEFSLASPIMSQRQ